MIFECGNASPNQTVWHLHDPVEDRTLSFSSCEADCDPKLYPETFFLPQLAGIYDRDHAWSYVFEFIAQHLMV